MRVLTAITDKVAKGDVFTEEVGSIKVRVHGPVSRVGHVPAFLWIHDGGFVFGTASLAEPPRTDPQR
jgi:hypothetical protein